MIWQGLEDKITIVKNIIEMKGHDHEMEDIKIEVVIYVVKKVIWQEIAQITEIETKMTTNREGKMITEKMPDKVEKIIEIEIGQKIQEKKVITKKETEEEVPQIHLHAKVIEKEIIPIQVQNTNTREEAALPAKENLLQAVAEATTNVETEKKESTTEVEVHN